MVKKRITYNGAVEGLEEKIYFNHLSSLINNSDIATKLVYFDFTNALGGSPLSVAKRVNRGAYQDILFEQNRIVAIYDYDFKDDSFLEADAYCKKNNIKNYYSFVNFDLWLLNHKVKYSKRIDKANDYVPDVRKHYHLNADVNIKTEENIYKIVNQITLEDVLMAVENAKQIKEQNEKCKTFFHKKRCIYDQPNLQLAEFIDSVLKECNLIIK